MQGHTTKIRLFAAMGAVAVAALGAGSTGSAKVRNPEAPNEQIATATEPDAQKGSRQLVSLGLGPCGGSETFVFVIEGRRGMPMC